MRNLHVVILGWIAIVAAPHLCVAQGSNQASVDAAVTAAERVCLSGNQFKFDLKSNGDLTIKKLMPGAAGEVHIDKNQTYGGTFFTDPKVRDLVDQRISSCMERQWPKIITYLTPQKVTQDFQSIGQNVNFDCDQSASSPADYTAPDGYYISQLNSETYATSNISSGSATATISPDKKSAHGVANFRGVGKNGPFNMNCPGGGHGAVRIYGVVTMLGH